MVVLQRLGVIHHLTGLRSRSSTFYLMKAEAEVNIQKRKSVGDGGGPRKEIIPDRFHQTDTVTWALLAPLCFAPRKPLVELIDAKQQQQCPSAPVVQKLQSIHNDGQGATRDRSFIRPDSGFWRTGGRR